MLPFISSAILVALVGFSISLKNANTIPHNQTQMQTYSKAPVPLNSIPEPLHPLGTCNDPAHLWIGEPLQKPLWAAVRSADYFEVEKLLEQGANPNSLYHGRTYLEIAAQNSLYNRFSDIVGRHNEWIPIIELLIKYGANPSQVNEKGLTPYQHYLQYVLVYPNPEIKALLALQRINDHQIYVA